MKSSEPWIAMRRSLLGKVRYATLRKSVFYHRTSVWRRKGMNGVSAKDLEMLYERQSRRCALTGKRLDANKQSIEADHIVPISKGGEHHIGNIQLVTPEANAAKGSLHPDDFYQLCEDVVAWRRAQEGVSSRDVSRAGRG